MDEFLGGDAVSMERRSFLGTILGGGLALPQSIGKIVEPTPREIEQVMKEKPSGVAVVSGQEIIAKEISQRYERLTKDFRGIHLEYPRWVMEITFENHFGKDEILTVRPQEEEAFRA